MTTTPSLTSLEQGVAQFFFEVGYAACWAEVSIKNSETPPFDITDAVIERTFQVASEVYEDGAEWDRYQALADAAPGLQEQVKELSRWLGEMCGAYAALCEQFDQPHHRVPGSKYSHAVAALAKVQQEKEKGD